ncbi:mitochondrial 54S ribosomal protein bL17m MRPL8 [Sporobolomyces salmoneus]|uniref:mitochondrial 54S ribosomal protein bL17m MRPL8 n=1 Tax=Sporobolomyces salmoneus TaxID=183962 RepID=UPI0031722C9B
MRHGLHLSKLSRTTSHRMLMLRNLVSSLLQHQQISTTLPKAKAAQKLADQVIGWGKKGGKENWERANAFLLNSKDTLTPLFTTFAQRYASRPGGYTRILRSGYRVGDNAPLAILELVDNKNDLRFENSAKTIGRELAIRTREKELGPEAFKEWREGVEGNGPEGIMEGLKESSELGEITRKNVVKALQFRLNEVPSLPVSASSTTKPLSSLPSSDSTDVDAATIETPSTEEPVKVIHPSTLFLDRVYHHYLSSLAQFTLSSNSISSSSSLSSIDSSLGIPDPERQISQLTQRLQPTDRKSPPKPVLTIPRTGKKFFAGESKLGYLTGEGQEEEGERERGMGVISKAKGDWSKGKLDRKRRVVRQHATEEMDKLEKEFEERL